MWSPTTFCTSPRPGGKRDTRYESKQIACSGDSQEEWFLPLCLLDTLDPFLCLFTLAQTLPRYKRTQGLGNFLENPLQFSSMLVKLQKRSQRGDFGTQLPINCNNPPGVFVNILPGVIGIIVRFALGTNWASSWRARAVSLKGHVSGGAPGDT